MNWSPINRRLRRPLDTLYRKLCMKSWAEIDPEKAPTFVNPGPVAEYRNAQGDPDFMDSMLPWIDRPDVDIEAYVKSLGRLPAGYDLREKLQHWRTYGYVIFEQAVDHRLIDTYVRDVRALLENHTKYNVRVEHELYTEPGRGSIPISKVARQDLQHRHMRLCDFHCLSVAGKKLALNPVAVSFLQHIFRDDVVAMQTLTFWHGTEQGWHQDFPYVRSGNLSHLAATWIALEDIQEDSGPLGYYPGSHRVRKFDWGIGNGLFPRTPLPPAAIQDYENHLSAECKRMGLTEHVFLAKKGDMFVWHGALCHRGTRTNNPSLTRLSLTTHYSSAGAYPRNLRNLSRYPKRYHHNGGFIYGDPENSESENIFTAGNSF